MKPYHQGWGVALSSRWGDRRASSKHDPHATAWTIMVGDAAVATSATSPQLTIGMALSLAVGAVSRAPCHLSQLHMPPPLLLIYYIVCHYFIFLKKLNPGRHLEIVAQF